MQWSDKEKIEFANEILEDYERNGGILSTEMENKIDAKIEEVRNRPASPSAHTVGVEEAAKEYAQSQVCDLSKETNPLLIDEYKKCVEDFKAGWNAASLPQSGDAGWVKVEDAPLFTKNELEQWECTEAGEKEFIAAIETNNGWWIRHCVVEDMIGLCVVGEDENEPAGYELEDVQYYFPLPSPPASSHLKQ